MVALSSTPRSPPLRSRNTNPVIESFDPFKMKLKSWNEEIFLFRISSIGSSESNRASGRPRSEHEEAKKQLRSCHRLSGIPNIGKDQMAFMIESWFGLARLSINIHTKNWKREWLVFICEFLRERRAAQQITTEHTLDLLKSASVYVLHIYIYTSVLSKS